ncbi:vacuolar transporter chaperone [Apophysomyces sp. BC1034]|nr:vacuolar transporter chaperone [Apophysomyces sp. BC1015]KAG0176330.1 vacuolar transporter chaperone [Apophysomyces sp. BC1021]KAG0186736.1 vacuolar transporter chaperone [Apophysomyces sp. BC1034]
MKFGEYLQKHMAAPWQTEYIQYVLLKQDLKTRQLDHLWNEADEACFVSLFLAEVDKVEGCIKRQIQKLDLRRRSCGDMRHLSLTSSCFSSTCESGSDITDDILADIHTLFNFAQLNQTGIRKLTKKHFKWTNRHLPAVDQRFDILMAELSHMRELCQPYTKFYWIHPDNMMQVKSHLQFYMPSNMVSDTGMSDVYFDNGNWDVYRGHLQLGDGADTTWLRWHGPLIFAGHKTQRSRECIKLEHSEAADFMQGNYQAELPLDDHQQPLNERDLKKSTQSALRIQTFIQSKQLKPAVRCAYRRTDFHHPDDPTMFLSLDTQLIFTRSGDHPQENGEIHKEEQFPYAVLAIATTNTAACYQPTWLSQLTTSHMVHEAPAHFSKYAHGVSQLFAVHQTFSNSSASDDDKRSLHCRSASPTVVVEMDNMETSTKKKKKTKGCKVEPKAFFANERTFISWLQFCALLLTVALNLLNFGDRVSRISGATFMVVSAILALYALGRYQYRAWHLRKRSKARYDDVYGPVALCLLIVLALLLNFYLRFRQQLPLEDDASWRGGD